MRVLYALFLVCACALTAAAEDPFPAAHALLPQHEHSTASGPALTLARSSRWRWSAIRTFGSWFGG